MSKIPYTPKKKQNRVRTAKRCIESSTPNKNELINYNISLSRIDTASSSSGQEIKQPLRISKKHIKILKKRRKQSFRRQQLANISKFSDNEWETESEKSVHESREDIPTEHNDDSACHNLFDYNSYSPDKIRDAAMVSEAPNESPIFHFSGKSRYSSNKLKSSKKNAKMQRDKFLLNLSSVNVQDVTPEKDSTDEDELIVLRERCVKTYLSTSQWRKSAERKPDNYMLPVRFPTETSDLLWDEFINKYRDDVSQYLASPSKRTPVESKDSAQLHPTIICEEDTNPIPSGMKRDYGYWDKGLQRWIIHRKRNEKHKKKIFKRDKKERNAKKKREASLSTQLAVTNVYDVSDETDIEFETGGQNNKRLSLQQFRAKQAKRRIHISEMPSISSNYDTE